MTLAEDLAKYALGIKFSDLDRTTLNSLKTRVVDAFGCALGAFGEDPPRIARTAAGAGKGRATILGTHARTSPELATFANGLMIRYFDFNDTYLSKEPAHPSDNLAACFAVAEEEEAGGRDVLAAQAVAYEIQCRLCDAADIRHRGWDHVNYGLVSTALAASRLMGLDARKAAHAVNIALNGHIAMRQVRAGELSMWKGASFSNAARNGVFAARLAREGMTGPAPIFEGEMGFFRQVSGSFSLDVGAFGGRGGSFKVNETYIKYWPAEYHAQTAIWAALELRKKVRDPAEIDSVLVETHEAGYTILGKDPEKWEPSTKETADHSLPFMVATALLDGTVDNGSYSEQSIRDPKVRSLMQRLKVKEEPELTVLYPSNGMPTRVTLRMKGGKRVSARVDVPRGHPLNPMTRDEIEAKFMKLAEGSMGSAGARSALRSLWGLEKMDDLRSIMLKFAAR